jgi:methionine sulfoxide reductase heme-binding subunit
MTVATSAAPHLFWITSRAAGIVSLVVASLAVSVGLMMSLRMLRARRPELLALHEVLSLATLVALAVHGLALLGDGVLSPSLGDIAVPFAWSYKTAWTSIGIIGGWALVILGLSYYARQAIGVTRWRKLHRLTALAWIAGIVHTLGEGTDAGQIWFLAMLAVVAVPAIVLLALRYLTDDASRPAAGAGGPGSEPRRVADHEARELPAAPRPAGTALG